MKKLFLFLVVLTMGLVLYNHTREHEHDDDTYLEELEHRIQCADWLTHEDRDLGYTMHYPSCFVPTETEDEGRVRFAYVEQLPLRSIVYMTLEVHTEVCRDTLNPYHELRQMARDMGGVCLRKSPTEYLMTAELQSRDPAVTAFRLQAKYVLRQRLWFVESFIYPEDFAPSVHRLVQEVNDWHPFP